VKKGGVADEQWESVRKELEAGLAAAGWSAEVAAKVDAVLLSLQHKSAATYLEASTWKVSKLAAAWDVAMRPARGTAAGAPGASSGTLEAATPLAVQLWATASDLLQRGLLSPAAPGNQQAVPDELRCKAAKQCQRALQALLLPASAQHVAAVAGLSAGSGKGTKAGADSAAGESLSDVRFQLRHCGHLLRRDQPATRDPRVESFNPDEWQRKVSCSGLGHPGPGLQYVLLGTAAV
jgi:hypothetical protein